MSLIKKLCCVLFSFIFISIGDGAVVQRVNKTQNNTAIPVNTVPKRLPPQIIRKVPQAPPGSEVPIEPRPILNVPGSSEPILPLDSSVSSSNEDSSTTEAIVPLSPPTVSQSEPPSNPLEGLILNGTSPPKKPTVQPTAPISLPPPKCRSGPRPIPLIPPVAPTPPVPPTAPVSPTPPVPPTAPVPPTPPVPPTAPVAPTPPIAPCLPPQIVPIVPRPIIIVPGSPVPIIPLGANSLDGDNPGGSNVTAPKTNSSSSVPVTQDDTIPTTPPQAEDVEEEPTNPLENDTFNGTSTDEPSPGSSQPLIPADDSSESETSPDSPAESLSEPEDI